MEKTVFRNAACPCGSGKKYKRCCSSSGDGVTTTAHNDFEISELIAYKGRLGRLRYKFCEEFIKEKNSNFANIARAQKEYGEINNVTVSCKKNCIKCCTHFIGGSLQECEAIAFFLYSRKESVKKFIKQYTAWRQIISLNEYLFRSVAESYRQMVIAGYKKEVHEQHKHLSQAYFNLDIPCPFLWNRQCLIYEVRPYGCASLFSAEKTVDCAKGCSPPSQMSVTSQYPEKSYFYGEENNIILSCVPVLVYQILKNGAVFLSTIPGLKNMEQDFLNDADVKNILKKIQNKQSNIYFR